MFVHILIVILGLSLFEVVSSIDNAIVNAHILKTMTKKYRKIFLGWGLIFAVFVVRGVLPFAIVWIANPDLTIVQAFTAAFSNNEAIKGYLESSRPLLLIGGGSYLFLIFLSWLFLEEKKYAFFIEKLIHRQGAWFYAISSLFTTILSLNLSI